MQNFLSARYASKIKKDGQKNKKIGSQKVGRILLRHFHFRELKII